MSLRTLGAPLSLTGPYREQGLAAAAAIEAWADARGLSVEISDDGGSPERAAEISLRLAAAHPMLLGPYASGPARAVARALASSRAVVWNHGGAAISGDRGRIIDVLAPAARYWEGLPGALRASGVDLSRVAILSGRSEFGRAVAGGAARALVAAGATPSTVIDFEEGTAARAVGLALSSGAAAIVTGARIEEELAVGRALSGAGVLGALVVCGIRRAGGELGDAVRGWLGPVQWVAGKRAPPIDIGPEPDYPAAQALAACLLLERARERAARSDDPDALWSASLELRTRTFFGPFAVDTRGHQIGHRPTLVRWVGRGASLRREPVIRPS